MRHHIFRGVLLAAFAFMIVYLFQTGQSIMFVAPRMELLVKLSALGLYAAAAYQFFAAIRTRTTEHQHDEACGCGHGHAKSPFANTIMYGLFLLPLLTVFLIPTSTLGSAMAEKKGISFSGSEAVNRPEREVPASTSAGNSSNEEGQLNGTGADPQKAGEASDSLEALFPYDQYTVDHAKLGMELYKQDLIVVSEKQFIETLTTLDIYRDALLGKEVELSGFVYREEAMGEDRIAVTRFAMNCCSADALPYGLVITWPRAKHFAEDEWIKVKGKLTVIPYDGIDIISLDATRVEPIEAPATPYVYPDLDFGS
ncbi:TIGR03943 family protein [Paenibacillus sp. PL2-23]|uniref:TIGR03943 family putative permease subunit n=1 Tax=Paenibacillus sp. PL2-23 TaxID=2100729 RepID=UPI0030FB5B84